MAAASRAEEVYRKELIRLYFYPVRGFGFRETDGEENVFNGRQMTFNELIFECANELTVWVDGLGNGLVIETFIEMFEAYPSRQRLNEVIDEISKPENSVRANVLLLKLFCGLVHYTDKPEVQKFGFYLYNMYSEQIRERNEAVFHSNRLVSNRDTIQLRLDVSNSIHMYAFISASIGFEVFNYVLKTFPAPTEIGLDNPLMIFSGPTVLRYENYREMTKDQLLVLWMQGERDMVNVYYDDYQIIDTGIHVFPLRFPPALYNKDNLKIIAYLYFAMDMSTQNYNLVFEHARLMCIFVYNVFVAAKYMRMIMQEQNVSIEGEAHIMNCEPGFKLPETRQGIDCPNFLKRVVQGTLNAYAKFLEIGYEIYCGSFLRSSIKFFVEESIKKALPKPEYFEFVTTVNLTKLYEDVFKVISVANPYSAVHMITFSASNQFSMFWDYGDDGAEDTYWRLRNIKYTIVRETENPMKTVLSEENLVQNMQNPDLIKILRKKDNRIGLHGINLGLRGVGLYFLRNPEVLFGLAAIRRFTPLKSQNLLVKVIKDSDFWRQRFGQLAMSDLILEHAIDILFTELRQMLTTIQDIEYVKGLLNDFIVAVRLWEIDLNSERPVTYVSMSKRKKLEPMDLTETEITDRARRLYKVIVLSFSEDGAGSSTGDGARYRAMIKAKAASGAGASASMSSSTSVVFCKKCGKKKP